LSSSVVHVAGGVDGGWQFADFHFKALLDLSQNLFVLVRLHERYRETFGSESASTTNSVQVFVALLGHVEVDYDVDLLDVNAAAEKLSRNEDAILELLEAVVDFKSVS
jgi:hypothetical protein